MNVKSDRFTNYDIVTYLTNVFNISKHTENYNVNEDEEKDTKISIISYREALTFLNKIKDYLMSSSIDS